VIVSASFDDVKSAQLNYANSSELIDSLLTGYDKRLRPNYGGAPVNVEISMYVITFDSFSDSNMDFTMNFYFRQHWNDPRLSFQRSGIETLNFGHELSKSIWVPDTFFVNEKQGFAHSVTSKNEFIKIYKSGNIMRSVRLTVTASCRMDFRRFPLDTQTCPLSIESYGYTASDIRYNWKDVNAVGISDDTTSINLFELTGHKEKSEYIELSTGNYSRLVVEFDVRRMTGYYLTQVYIPCTMIVIISWISFWLNRRSAQVRLVLCALAMLLLPLLVTILATQMPKTAYTKAIDVYTGVCMTFVFVALVEFAYISNTSSDKEEDYGASKLDRIFRYGFAALFIVFNIIYWIVY